MRLLRARWARSFTASLISRSDLFCAARHDRRDQSIFDRDRDREIDILILHDRVVIEGSVDLRHLHRGVDRGFEDEIVDRDLGGVAPLARGFQLGARRHQRAGIDLDLEIKMRHRAFALDEALRDHLAHPAEMNARAFRGLWRGGAVLLLLRSCLQRRAVTSSPRARRFPSRDLQVRCL